MSDSGMVRDEKATAPAPAEMAAKSIQQQAVRVGGTRPLANVQTRLDGAGLQVGGVDDPHEREADQVAKAVMRVLTQAPPQQLVNDQPPDTSPGNAGGSARVQRRIQRSAAAAPIGPDGGAVDDVTGSRIKRARGTGNPLDDSVRRSMEQGFGADFSNVRVHSDSGSDDLNTRLQARAFTTGNDIFFSRGAYSPTTSGGRELLAHELTHTIQQGASSQTDVGTSPTAQRSATRVQRAPAPKVRVRSNQVNRVQRRLAFTAADLGGKLSVTAQIKGLFGQESTYSKIQGSLAEYEAADGWSEQLAVLNTLKGLAETWLANHQPEAGVDDPKRASIADLLAKVDLEIPVATKGIQDDADEQTAYVDAVKTGNLKYLSQGGKSIAKKVEKWKNAIDILTDQENQANRMIATYGLTLAEAMAIGIYTADDYKVINPALADNDGWMQAMLPRLGVSNLKLAGELATAITATHLAEAKIEGQLHGKIAAAGMKKLPDWKGSTFRGLGLTQGQFEAEYPPKGTATFPAFSSTSLKEDVSRSFAGSNAGGGKLGILLRLKCTQGKDIAMLSNSPGEREILLMPGATFAVVKITDGTHRDKPIKIVDLKQTS